MYFDPLYLLIMGIGIGITLFAQIKVKGAYSKYSKISNTQGLTGMQAAQKVLDSAGITNVSIQPVSGVMSDHYDPRNNTICLSEGVYNVCSIAAVGIACHEAGHAIQHARGYSPLKLRNTIIPVSNYGPMIGMVLMMIGMFINMLSLIWLGIILFGFTFLFQLVTLPVEFDASRRALSIIESTGMLNEQEYTGAKKMLTAAALTYVAAMLQSLLTLLYYIMRFTGRRR